MKQKVRFVQYGCGKMGKMIARFAVEKGAELVGALDRNKGHIGKTVDAYFGIEGNDSHIADSGNADELLKAVAPDICIIATRSLMCEVKDIMLLCARNGINVITTCEEALYPWNSAPEITLELDQAAKENNCTITGTGANESQYGCMFRSFGGNIQKVKKITASAQYNIDDYGKALAEGHGAGLTIAEFEKTMGQGDFVPSYVWNANGWICDYLGLTVRDQQQELLPRTAEVKRYSKTLEFLIPAGNAIGMESKVTTTTEEGIDIETSCIGIVYDQEEDFNICKAEGVPDLELIVKNPDTVEMTCASVVNRIPDVIDAPPGYICTSRLPVLRYRERI